MTRDSHHFPAAVYFAFRLESRFFSKPTQQSIGVEMQQIVAIKLHRLFERAIEQAHVSEIKVMGFEMNPIRYARFRLLGLRCPSECMAQSKGHARYPQDRPTPRQVTVKQSDRCSMKYAHSYVEP